MEEGDSVEAIIDHLSAFLLNLDCIHNIPSRCIDDIVEELQFISSSASLPVIKNIILDTFKVYYISVAFCNGGPLASAY